MGKNKTPDPEWYVYIDNFNTRTIEKFNVFHSYNFLNGCKKAFKKFKKPEQLEELEKEIRAWAMYSFWSKCEYEIVLSGLFSKDKARKIDVYQQLMLNWDAFFEYTYKHKAFFLRRER